MQRVFATKPGQATVRPFIRVHPVDLLLYQALVDAIRDPIENSLGAREQVFAYRMAPIEKDDPFDESPTWRDFEVGQHQLALTDPDGYIIEGDVSGFFLNINIDELERRLLEAGCGGDIVRDLGGLLKSMGRTGSARSSAGHRAIVASRKFLSLPPRRNVARRVDSVRPLHG